MTKFGKIAVMLVVLVMTIAVSFGCANGSDNNKDNGTKSKTHVYYMDNDGDGYGDASQTVSAENMPTGYSSIAGDCDNNDPTVNPGAEEMICNDVDENCDNDLGSASATIYSSDELDGIMYYYRGGFVSYFNGGISPQLNGFFTFDVSGIDWNYVDTAYLNAYMVGDFQPCDPGDVFYPPEFRLNDMGDQYYAAFTDCGCRLEKDLVCPDPADNIVCQYLYDEVLYTAMPSAFTPWYSPGSWDYTQTSNWWRAKVTDNYFAPIGSFWTDLNKSYVSIFPDTGSCFTPDNLPYPPHTFSFEDGGNHQGTGNVPYLEVTCQP